VRSSKEKNNLKPTFRIVAVPVKPKENLINNSNQYLWNLIKKPPELLTMVSDSMVLMSLRELKAVAQEFGYAQQKITVLQNGFIEFTAPLLNRHFQHYKSEKKLPVDNWLYPYTIFEMPLTFYFFC